MSTCDFCKTCLTLDYKMSKNPTKRKRLLLRKPIDVQNPMMLEKLPGNLLAQVFTKMNQSAFYRMRRSNRNISNFINNNCDALKIAMFHNMDFEFKSSNHNCDVYGGLTLIISRDYSLPEKPTNLCVKGRKEREVISEEIDGKVCFVKDKYSISISIKCLMEFPDFRRELTGCFRPTMFIYCFNAQHDKSVLDTEFELIQGFVKWAKCQKQKCCFGQMDYNTLSNWCHLLKPSDLYLRGCGELPDDLLDFKGFENVKKFKYWGKSYNSTPTYLLRLEELTIFSLQNIDFHQIIIDLLRKWCAGESNLSYLCVKYLGTVKSLEGVKSQKLERNFQYLHPIQGRRGVDNHKLLDLYQLKQENSDEEAVFCLFEKYYYFYVMGYHDSTSIINYER